VNQRILVTGGSGFIGSNFLLNYVRRYPENQFVNLDKLTYAGHSANLVEISEQANYKFEKVDLCDRDAVDRVFSRHDPTQVLHLAGESHVDRSIQSPDEFIQTNVVGSFNLLEACRHSTRLRVLVMASTDEVFGSLGSVGVFTESSPYRPSSPYSASKAAADHLARAYHQTYGLPVIVTNSSNNYGPRQFPEKLIPLMILNALEGNPLPIYGTGEHIRDWLFVEDQCEALWLVLNQGTPGETYLIGGQCERTNLEVVGEICAQVAQRTGAKATDLLRQIRHIEDRSGHDFRYAVDPGRMKSEFNWVPQRTFDQGIGLTVDWYANNQGWIESVRSKRPE
jgi:dTDP-glucose 4,6-dehydratase